VTKFCPACGSTKHADAFYKSKTTKSGLHGWCKSCSRAKAKAVYESEQSARKREQRKIARRERTEHERAIYRASLIEKTCARCRQTKPADAFAKSNRGRTGLQSWCKSCQTENARVRRVKRITITPDPLLTHKRCTRCGEKQPVSQFARNRTAPDGYQYACRGCQRVYDQARYWKKSRNLSAVPNPIDAHLISMRRRLVHLERRSILHSLGVFDISQKDMRRLARSSCTHCGSNKNIQIDHIIPVARGGRHSIGNLQTLCRSCNTSKSNLLEVEWRHGWSVYSIKRSVS
jgi:5-methylcytosine-specific restriction endonuclease McrA